MIKAVIFDMFETLVTLFTGRTYFSDRAYEPHIPCPLLPDFLHADTREDIIKYLETQKS